MEPLTFSQVNGEVQPAAVAGVFTAADGIIFAIIFFLICIIIWLSNREIRISGARTRASIKMLEPERDALEKRIAERTTDFVRSEEQRMIELQRNSEFGKLAQGLFHDLMSPLSSISLYAEKNEVYGMIDASRRINSFMESVRRTLGTETASRDVISLGIISDPEKEIYTVLDILGYKARMAGVQIKVEVDPKEKLLVPIHPVRLHQLILNLVSNAIDACVQASDSRGNPTENLAKKLTEKSDHVVTISVAKKEITEGGVIDKSVVELSVSDTGCGISPENQDQMFKKQFTTKKDGTGIGLMTVKTIVEKDLGGTIKVISEEGKGTTFIVIIPTN